MENSSDIYTTVYVLSHNMQWLTFFGGWVKGKRSSDNKKKSKYSNVPRPEQGAKDDATEAVFRLPAKIRFLGHPE